MVEIKNRFTGAVIATGETIKAAVESTRNLCEADLRGRDLCGADLRGRDLREVDLREVDLREVNLRWANLREVDLRGATLNWCSHDLLGEILRQAAGDDVERRKIAGLVMASRDWCWSHFAALAKSDPQGDWAMGVLAVYAAEDENAPAVLRDWAAVGRE